MKRTAKRLGRPPLKAGRHERVNLTLPPDVLEALGRYGPTRSGAVTHLTRAEMSRRGELPPLAVYPGYEP